MFTVDVKQQQQHQLFCKTDLDHLTLLHSERPKLYTVLAFLSAVGLTAKLHKTDVHFGSKFGRTKNLIS